MATTSIDTVTDTAVTDTAGASGGKEGDASRTCTTHAGEQKPGAIDVKTSIATTSESKEYKRVENDGEGDHALVDLETLIARCAEGKGFKSVDVNRDDVRAFWADEAKLSAWSDTRTRLNTPAIELDSRSMSVGNDTDFKSTFTLKTSFTQLRYKSLLALEGSLKVGTQCRLTKGTIPFVRTESEEGKASAGTGGGGGGLEFLAIVNSAGAKQVWEESTTADCDVTLTLGLPPRLTGLVCTTKVVKHPYEQEVTIDMSAQSDYKFRFRGIHTQASSSSSSDSSKSHHHFEGVSHVWNKVTHQWNESVTASEVFGGLPGYREGWGKVHCQIRKGKHSLYELGDETAFSSN